MTDDSVTPSRDARSAAAAGSADVWVPRSPLLISIMFACHCSPYPRSYLGDNMWDSPASIACRGWLQDNELIDDGHMVTDRGKAWVNFIVNTPLPVAVWSLPAEAGMKAARSAAEEPSSEGVNIKNRSPGETG